MLNIPTIDLFNNCDGNITKLNDFLMLLECPNYEQYIKKRFSHFLKVPFLLLKNSDYKVVSPQQEQLILENSISVNYEKVNFYFTLTKNKKQCVIVLFSDYNDGYNFHIWESLNDEYIEITRLYNSSYAYEEYNSSKLICKYDNNIEILLKLVDKHFYKKTYNYGYLENEQLYNETHIN